MKPDSEREAPLAFMMAQRRCAANGPDPNSKEGLKYVYVGRFLFGDQTNSELS